MPYKVVLVEDEIITREGIRDNVDWKRIGFEFCGEAPDGEMALQLLQTVQPDVLITDIRMPFMDGLQLGLIVRERMPWVKMVILSGHDEFEYAQAAIKLGVTEYLLKPVTVPDLHKVLAKIATQLDQEKAEQEKLRRLQDQIQENQAALRERFLFKLAVGAISSTEAVEKSQQLGLDLIACYYQIVIIKTELADRSEQFNYDEYQQVSKTVSDLIAGRPNLFLLKKDWEELVLLIKGNTLDGLQQERALTLERIQQELVTSRYRLTIGSGGPKNRITYIYQSFIEALENIQNTLHADHSDRDEPVEKTELLKVDKSAVENYLRSGDRKDFDEFFNAFIRPLGETAFKSRLIKNYFFIDVVLAIAQFIHELGGDIDQAIPSFHSIETILMNIKTIEQLREQVHKIVDSALAFRDDRARDSYGTIIQQAKAYINSHYADSDLSLNEVAEHVSFSPNHFSAVFSDETGETFRDYLTRVRIEQAKKLLRTTKLMCSEVAVQCGYNDPHYFSIIFRKNTGLTPQHFRKSSNP